jgi:hypothetical protein
MMSSSQVELDGVVQQDPQVFGNPDNQGIRHRSRGGGPTGYEPVPGVQQQALNQSEKTWSLLTVIASFADVVASSSIMFVAFKYAYRDNGVSLYCLGMQAISHMLSSILLLVRLVGELLFYRTPDSNDVALLREKRRNALLTEQGTSVCMGIVMLISSVALLFKAFRKLRFWDKWYLDHVDMDREAAIATDWLAWWGFGIYSLQALFRFFAARKLRQSLVWHSFWASVVSLLYLLVLGIAAWEEKEWSWKAEPIAAIVLSMVTLAEGIRIIYEYFDDMDTRLLQNSRA